jgi:asparaginyl-tRNA synthetase
MELVTVRDLFKHTADYAGKTVSVGGWVRSVRASKTFGFIVLSDGTFFQPLQVVHDDEQGVLQFRRHHDWHLNRWPTRCC